MKTQKMPQNIANVDAVLQCQHNWKTNVVHKQDSLALPSPLFPQLVVDGNVRPGTGHALQGRHFSVK
jgi:hypothetical protein